MFVLYEDQNKRRKFFLRSLLSGVLLLTGCCHVWVSVVLVVFLLLIVIMLPSRSHPPMCISAAHATCWIRSQRRAVSPLSLLIVVVVVVVVAVVVVVVAADPGRPHTTFRSIDNGLFSVLSFWIP